MYFGGENQPPPADFRPELHDSDGLQISADGESLWRPLARPARPFTTTFSAEKLQGFGLMQRDTDYASYQDLEARYERRPSAWIEPTGDWGPGRVVLMQLPARDEADDNMVAFWQPAQPLTAGSTLGFSWRIHWSADAWPQPALARVLQTRQGFGYRKVAPAPGDRQFHVDFVGAVIAKLKDENAVSADVTATNVRDLKARVQPNPHTGGWRLTFEFERIDSKRAVELRALLRNGSEPLSETWTYALAPE